MPVLAYRGRFAPSPTGPLHFGSLVTALASYCEAKSHAGQWLVRIEDTDTARIQPGATTAILTALQAFGFEWDETVVYQHQRLALYEQALAHLHQNKLIYGCRCSRKHLAGWPTYPKHCRHQQLPFEGHAIRLMVPDDNICFNDQIQGKICDNLSQTVGDFVLKRRDGIISYQLAVVVDDALQGITHVVRGADLLDNTARQIWLGDCLDFPRLHYGHVPLAMNRQGQKLSKQNLALPLDIGNAPHLIGQALQALNQPAIDRDSPAKMLAQAVSQWDMTRILQHTRLQGQFE